MGIDGFRELFGELIDDAKNIVDISSYAGKIVIVDGHLQLHRMRIGKIGKCAEIINNDGKNVSHVYDLFSHVLSLVFKRIMPFYVFDGGISVEKLDEAVQRSEDKCKAYKKCQEIEDKTSCEYIRQAKRCYRVTATVISDCVQLLELLGIPYVVCEKEADQQCVALYNYYSEKMPDRMAGIITDDTDILAFGGQKILKNFSLKTKTAIEIKRQNVISLLRKKSNLIRMQKGLNPVKITHDSFIDLAILMGTDYLKKSGCKIIGIKPNLLHEVFVVNDLDVNRTVRELKKMSGVTVSKNFSESFVKIKNVYVRSMVFHPQDISIVPRIKRTDKLIDLLCNGIIGIDKELITNQVNMFTACIQVFLIDLFPDYLNPTKELIDYLNTPPKQTRFDPNAFCLRHAGITILNVLNNMYKHKYNNDNDNFANFKSFKRRHDKKKRKIENAAVVDHSKFHLVSVY